jgi:CDP-diglyceride synthetase
VSKKVSVLPKNTLKKLVWGLAFFVLIVWIVWIVKHPYQARDAVHTFTHALSVLFSGWGGGR